MSFYRIVLSIAGLCVLFSFLALPTSCGEEKQVYVLKAVCTTKINVDPNTGVDIQDAYVCKNNKVTWVDNGHIFFVFFKKDCAFGPGGCKQIDNQHPTAGPIKYTTNSTVYDYGIVVDGKPFDPHIIGGGD